MRLVGDRVNRACVLAHKKGACNTQRPENSEKSSSRKPAVPKVATYRILTQVGEYLASGNDPGAGRRAA
jgi:hypothetical protein